MKNYDNELKSKLFDNFIRVAKEAFKLGDTTKLDASDLKSLAWFTIGYFGLMED